MKSNEDTTVIADNPEYNEEFEEENKLDSSQAEFFESYK